VALALARKYRPRTFEDLVGQESVSLTLSQALDGDRLTHAYLFSGLRGSGKTSTARIFSKALLCEKGPSSRPCEECPHCIMANENRHMDIIEMDAASNRGIDDIKELIEHTKYKPGSGRYKIFIIDEVHMLTPQAFNALLKTLEEPPDFIKFILATTDPLKLPATILSRTQHFRFKKISPKLVTSHLEHILNLEGIEYEKEAVEIVARSGAGSLRDSLTLLDQAIVYSKNHLDVATVTGMLGIIEPSVLEKLLDAVVRRDREGILSFVRLSGEYEPEMILDELILYLKDSLLDGDKRFSTMVLDRFFRILSDSKNLLSIGSDGEFVISLTLFKMVEALSIREVDEMIKTLRKELSGVSTKVTHEKMVSEPVKTESTVSKTESTVSQPKKRDGDISVDDMESDVTVENSSESPDGGKLRFESLKEKLYDRDYDLGSCFERSIEYVSFGQKRLEWRSSAEGDDRKILKEHWQLIRTFVEDTFGVGVKIVNLQPLEKDSRKSDTPASEDDTDGRDEGGEPPDEPSGGSVESRDTVGECDLPDNAVSSGTIESVEFGSQGCVDSGGGSGDASVEREPSDLLEEPMVREAIALFDPKKVRIRRKS